MKDRERLTAPVETLKSWGLDCGNCYLYLGSEQSVTSIAVGGDTWRLLAVFAGEYRARYRQAEAEQTLRAGSGDVVLWPPLLSRWESNAARPRLRIIVVPFLWRGAPAGLPIQLQDRQGFIRAAAQAMLLSKGPVLPERSVLWEGYLAGMLAEYIRLATEVRDPLGGLVARYVQEHLREPIRLRELAGAAGLSPFHFERRYKAATGRSVMADVRRMRAEHVVSVLQGMPDITLRAAAEKVGLSGERALSRLLKQQLGIPSRAIRASGGRERQAGPATTTAGG